MASPPSRTDLAGTPTVATYKLAIGALYDYVASLLGNGTATIASETEKKLARENLGVGQFGSKNKLINGAFLVDQRNGGSASTITAGAAIKYTLDRWYASCTGANISVQQVAGIASQAKSARLTGASGCTATLYGQRIEAANSADLKNQNVTTSLFIKSSSARVVTWSAYYANSADNFSAKTLISSGTINATTTADFFSFSFNAGSNAGNGIAIELTTGGLGIGETIIYDQLQLEKSSIATEFECRLVSAEIILCQRYFYKTYNLATAIGSISLGGCVELKTQSTNSFHTFPTLKFSSFMRVSPTVTLYSPNTGASSSAYNTSSTLDVSAVSSLVGDSGTNVYINNVSIGAGVSLLVHVVASAEI